MNPALSAPPECWRWQKPASVWKRVREVRRHGVVTDAGTYRSDIFGISVPLLDLEGHVQGALTLTGLSHGHSKAQSVAAALRTGIDEARMDYVFFTDADLQFDIGELQKLVGSNGKAKD